MKCCLVGCGNENLPESAYCSEHKPSASPSGYDENGCLPCPFCGGECDPDGWLDGCGVSGPECITCGATTTTVNTWNHRVTS